MQLCAMEDLLRKEDAKVPGSSGEPECSPGCCLGYALPIHLIQRTPGPLSAFYILGGPSAEAFCKANTSTLGIK